MIRYQHAVLLMVMLLLVFTFGCASYEAVAVPKLQPEFAANAKKQNDVIVAVRVFSKDDCRKYFDKDVISEGYQPIQVAVDNRSKEYLLLSKSGISLPMVPPEEVAKKCYRSTAGRATAYGVGALFLWPLAVPAIVDGVKSSNANTQMDIDFAAKGLQESVIQPFSNISGVIFVPTSEFKSYLGVNLINKESNEKLTFEFIDLK
jgi:hypothetical protein